MILQATQAAQPAQQAIATQAAMQSKGLAPSIGTIGAGSTLPAKTQNLSIRQGIRDMMNPERAGNEAITVFNRGNIINAYAVPPTMVVTLATGAGYAGAPINIFNNDIYNAKTANVTYTFNDGFNGNYYNNLFKTAVGANGILCYGFNISATFAGAPSNQVIQSANITMNYYNGYGLAIPNNIDLSLAFRNTQYQSGLLTVKTQFNLNATCQFQLVLPAYASGATLLTLAYALTPID